MNLKNRWKVRLKPIEKYMFKPTFWLKFIIKLICHKLGNEYQHMF
jgi:hypothetical protein